MPSFRHPIALFAYNRPQHTRRCLQSLAECGEARNSSLTAFVDGPRDEVGLALQRQVVASIEEARAGFGQVNLVVHERNKGLAGNVVSGVSQIIADHGSVIVIEDDLLVDHHFLTYMNQALTHYERDDRVGCIHAYCYPDMPGGEPFFFMRGADCWGWGTWRDRWQLFEADGQRLLRALLDRRQLRDFTLDYTAPYCRMLCQQILRRNASWAIRWHTSLFLADRLTLYPRRSLVQNIGLDGSGTHCAVTAAYDSSATPAAALPAFVSWPDPKPSDSGRRHFQHFFSGGRSGLARTVYRVVSWLNDRCWILRALHNS